MQFALGLMMEYVNRLLKNEACKHGLNIEITGQI